MEKQMDGLNKYNTVRKVSINLMQPYIVGSSSDDILHTYIDDITNSYSKQFGMQHNCSVCIGISNPRIEYDQNLEG